MVYTVREMAKLRGIGCMKKAGMSVKDSESCGHGQCAAEEGAFGCAGALSENSGRASDRTGQKHKVKDKAGANRYDR